jgi:hypothetical protein
MSQKVIVGKMGKDAGRFLRWTTLNWGIFIQAFINGLAGQIKPMVTHFGPFDFIPGKPGSRPGQSPAKTATLTDDFAPPFPSRDFTPGLTNAPGPRF